MPDTDAAKGFLARLNINTWYKYLLYLGGALLLVAVYQQIQFTIAHPTDPIPVAISRWSIVALYTVIIGVVLWFIEELLTIIGEHFADERDEEKEFACFVINYVSHALFLAGWVAMVALTV